MSNYFDCILRSQGHFYFLVMSQRQALIQDILVSRKQLPEPWFSTTTGYSCDQLVSEFWPIFHASLAALDSLLLASSSVSSSLFVSTLFLPSFSSRQQSCCSHFAAHLTAFGVWSSSASLSSCTKRRLFHIGHCSSISMKIKMFLSRL